MRPLALAVVALAAVISGCGSHGLTEGSACGGCLPSTIPGPPTAADHAATLAERFANAVLEDNTRRISVLRCKVNVVHWSHPPYGSTINLQDYGRKGRGWVVGLSFFDGTSVVNRTVEVRREPQALCVYAARPGLEKVPSWTRAASEARH